MYVYACVYVHACVCVYRECSWSSLTFFNHAAILVQHALDLTAPDIHQPHLGHEGLLVGVVGANGVHRPHTDQERHIMLV